MKKQFIIMLMAGLSNFLSYGANISTQIELTLHYPTENANADNLIFKSVKPEINKRLNNYPYYTLEKKDWNIGQLFQLLVNTTPENFEEMKNRFIVFSVDAEGISNLHYPLDLYYSKAVDGRIVVPGVHSAISIAHEGTEELCLLYAPNGFEDVDAILSLISQQTEGNIEERLNMAIPGQMASTSKIDYESKRLSFSTTDTIGIVPVFIHVQTEKREDPVEIEQPTLHLLSVGAGNINLQFTENDAVDFNKTIATQEGKIYKEIRSEVLNGDDVTAVGIVDKVYKLYQQYIRGEIEKEDYIMLYISSNGYMKDDELYFQFRPDEDGAQTDSELSYTEIHRILEMIPCKKVLFFDASASGIGDSDPPIVYTPLDPIRPLFMENFVTFLSNQKGEFSYEHENWENGAFTEAILEGLNGQADTNKDGYIMMSELLDFVTTRTNELSTSEHQKPQTPVIANRTVEDFVVFKY